MSNDELTKKSLRKESAQIIWCAGGGNSCGYYSFLNQLEKALLRHMQKENLTKEDVNVVAGIGCSSRLPFYQDVNAFHTTHGNGVSFAEGMSLVMKMQGKKGLVYSVGGDGDHLAIGVSNFMNACRDNTEMTIFLLNNQIYGMTSGQTSPTTVMGTSTKSAPYGVLEQPWDPVSIALTAGASYVARASTFPKDNVKLEEFIYDAFNHKGLSVVVVDSQCPTQNPHHRGLTNKEMCEHYFKTVIDLNKIYARTEYKDKTGELGNLTLTFDNGIVLEDKLAEFVKEAGEFDKKLRYEILRNHLDKNNGSNLILAGKIIEFKRETLEEAMAKQREKLLSKFSKDAKKSDYALKLLEDYKL